MSEPTAADKEKTKERMRAALDVLEHYVDKDGRLNVTKMTQHIRELEATVATLEAERDQLEEDDG
jgi:hypothetical protein